jgi:GxxExxY protein
MHTDTHGCKDPLIEQVLGAAFEVQNLLGAGFLEKVYERALARELVLRGVRVSQQVRCPISYKGTDVGEYIADLLVDDQLLVELKCADRLASVHMAQWLNYLKAAGLRLGLLINFQRPRLEYKRIILG